MFHHSMTYIDQLRDAATPPLSQPELLAELERATIDIPRYLYRSYSIRDLNGSNSDLDFASAAARNNQYHSSLAEMQYDVAQAKLRKRLGWPKFNDEEFISWKSSLLWALQVAVRKIKYSAEHELRVCVLDSSRFDTSTLFSAPRLIQAFGFSESRDMIEEYYTTTYSAHGSLNVRSCASTVSLACLRECGLFDLMLVLDDEYWKQRPFLRVRNFRETIVSAVNHFPQ